MTFSCKRKSYVFSLHYLCGMETMTKKFCKKYKLPENTLHELLSHMAEVRFSKGELIISEGERNSNFYLLKKGIWRAYYDRGYGKLPLVRRTGRHSFLIVGICGRRSFPHQHRISEREHRLLYQ